MNVRPATLEDIGAIVELLRVMQEESPIYRRFTSDYAKQYRTLMSFILSPQAYVGLLEDKSGVLIGHIEQTLWFTESFAWDDIIFVKPDLRKTSRAKMLLEAFTLWGKDQGAFEIRVGFTTGVQPESTITFFEHLGYTPFGAFFYKEL